MSHVGCFWCSERTGLFCPHWTNMKDMVDNEEDLRIIVTTNINGYKHFIGDRCSGFTRIPIAIIVAFNGKTIFDGELS